MFGEELLLNSISSVTNNRRPAGDPVAGDIVPLEWDASQQDAELSFSWQRAVDCTHCSNESS